MRTLDFFIRGQDVFFRCTNCDGQVFIDRDASFMMQLRAIANDHVCWVPFVMPVPRSEQRPALRLVPSPEEGATR